MGRIMNNHNTNSENMKMQEDPNEIAKINEFLSLAAPFVISRVKRLFESLGLDVKEQGRGNDLAFVIESGKVEVTFLPYNMMLDIATINRRATPLKFDEDVRQLDFFLAKTAHVVENKLRVVFDTLAADDPDTAIERLCQGTRSDEWLRAWKFDPKGQNVSPGQQRLSAIGEFTAT